MKCTDCKKAALKEVLIDDLVEIEGGPSIKVSDISALRCPSCGKTLMNSIATADRTRKALAGLLEYYASRTAEVPGKVSLWMRKAIDLPTTELAEITSLDPSTFAHAEKKNSTIDHFAAIVILTKVTDFISGGTEAQTALKTITELEQFLDASLLKSVEVIPSQGAT